MKNTFILITSLFLLNSCNKIKEKFDFTNSSDELIEEQNLINDENYKSLEGTPFTFNNSICSRRLFGSDIIKVLSNYKFTPISGRDYPYTLRLNEGGYLTVLPQKNSSVYYGNMKVSGNGEFVYFDAYAKDLYQNYQRTEVKMKFTPIQKPNQPFQIEIEIEQNGELKIKEKLELARKKQSSNNSSFSYRSNNLTVADSSIYQNGNNSDSYFNEKIKYIFSANGGAIIYFDNGKYVKIPEYSKENIRNALNKTPDGSYRINTKGELIQDDDNFGIIPENEVETGLIDWVVINYKWIRKPH